ncbi:DNA recombination protein RmuC [Thermophilibacter sp.]
MDLLALAAALVAVVALVVVLIELGRTRSLVDGRLSEVRDVVDGRLAQQLGAQQASLANQQRAVADQQRAVSEQLAQADRRLQEIRTTLDVQLKALQEDNAAQLERMRATVDEKLQRTLNERISQSFSLVNERLAQVDRGLGEMKGLAQDVGGLKRVLSNVKTRGIVGEIQLGAILKEILAPGQYEENVEVVAGSGRRVEFAVKLPGESGETTWLPIDAKFPGDAYEHLRAAEESGDAEAVERAWRQLEERLRLEAKDIHEKYVAPPETTSFGILFLPFEGLYAEVVGRPGLLERLQRDWRVSVAGPSTMAALLNSLQMGFQTVAIQRRADEIQQVLAAVKTEFATYQGMLAKAQKQLGTVSKTIDQLAGRRSRAMERRLRGLTELDSLEEADRVLGIDAADDADSDVAAEPDGPAEPAGPAGPDAPLAGE